MDAFYRTHTYLVEHTSSTLRRYLMDEIDWSMPMIGIKGTRGVGKTTFLLQYAKENFAPDDRKCLYVNMNNFYFHGRGLADFAAEFYSRGGRVLLVDQVFKTPDWSKELRKCHDTLPDLKVIFTGSSVMRLKQENPELNGIVSSHNLRGLSFREFVNMQTGQNLPAYTLDEILSDHEKIIRKILPKVSPMKYFQDYLHHGFYPFFCEPRNYSEILLNTMNMVTEVDILLIKQIELKYLNKIKKLFYLLAQGGTKSPNISKLAQQIETSRATVMTYLKYLADARLINLIYSTPDTGDIDVSKDEPLVEVNPAALTKKPTKVMMHNSNLMYAIYPIQCERQDIMETFFVNSMWKDHKVSQQPGDKHFTIDGRLKFRVIDDPLPKSKSPDDTIYARYNTEVSHGERQIPLWLFGFLY